MGFVGIVLVNVSGHRVTAVNYRDKVQRRGKSGSRLWKVRKNKWQIVRIF